MSKHPLDRQTGESPSRAERYAEIERRTAPEGSHPAAKKAQRQPRERSESTRLKEFARVERGDEV